MSWCYLDDSLPEHPKWVGLSDGAFRLGIRILCHCRRFNTSGWISLATIKAWEGSRATRLINELMRAGAPRYSSGILEESEGGFQVHGYQDYYANDEEKRIEKSEATRSRAEAGRIGGLKSAAVRRESNGTAQPVSRKAPESASENASSFASESASEANQVASSFASEVASNECFEAHRSIPEPPITNTNTYTATTIQRPDRSRAPEAPEPSSPSVSGARIPCPDNLSLSETQRAQLAMQRGAEPWELDELEFEFRGSWCGRSDSNRTLGAWRTSLFKAVNEVLSDRKRRPKRPEPESESRLKVAGDVFSIPVEL